MRGYYQLRFGRLTGRGYPVVEPKPIVNGFWIGHSLEFGLGGGARRGTRLIGADSFPRISNPCFPSASRAFDVTLPDRRTSFSSFVFSMPYLMRATWLGIIPYPVRSGQELSGKQISAAPG